MKWKLWFDVGIKRYTTGNFLYIYTSALWFDVGIKRYTTGKRSDRFQKSCGLM